MMEFKEAAMSRLTTCVVAVFVLLTCHVVAQNPQRIALLRWYDVNSSPQAGFDVKDPSDNAAVNPYGVSFDGENIWVFGNVPGTGDGRVVKMKPSDGTVVGRAQVGASPLSAVYDGYNMVIANYSSDTLSFVGGSAMTIRAVVSLPASPHPEGITFDGANIWTTGCQSGTLIKVPESTFSPTTVYTGQAGGCLNGVAFDGTNLWVTDYINGTVAEVPPTGGSALNTWSGFTHANGIAFAGNAIWVAAEDFLKKIDIATGNVTAYAVGLWGRGVIFDGEAVWVANSGSNSVSRVRVSDGLVTTVNVGVSPRGLAFDGANIFVANSSSTYISKR
jgi:YVTN family beta-propeller protein